MLNEGSITQDQYDKQLYKRLETNKLIVYQKDLRVLAIYREMSAGSTMNPQTIKNEDVSEKEYAAVSQQLDSLPGVNTTMDWDRRYLMDTLRSIFGSVSTSSEGIPKELTEQYLAKGYSRNDELVNLFRVSI